MTNEFGWIAEYIEDAVYPASKDDLIKAAEVAGAPEEVFDRLRALPGERFAEPSDVAADLG